MTSLYFIAGRASVVLRAARASDIPAIQRVRASVKENRLVSTVVTDEDVRTAIEDTGRGWVVEKAGEVVAFAIGNAVNGNIWALFVRPEAEGRGYGRQLHDTMVDWLWTAGLDRLWLTTEPGTRAQRFYEAAGWHLTGLTDRGELRYEMQRR
jgi:GNAT superfamily N-acetyltransferase